MPKNFMSDYCKELIVWMLKKNPNDRPTIEQIKHSEFYTQYPPKKEEIY